MSAKKLEAEDCVFIRRYTEAILKPMSCEWGKIEEIQMREADVEEIEHRYIYFPVSEAKRRGIMAGAEDDER